MKTKIKPQHTPTPWYFEKGRFNSSDLSDAHIGSIVSEEDFILAAINGDAGSKSEVEANAAFIVRAVNSHEELLELVRAVAKCVEINRAFLQACENAITKAGGK